MKHFPPAAAMSALFRYADELDQIEPGDRLKSALVPEFVHTHLKANTTSCCCVQATSRDAAELLTMCREARASRRVCIRNHDHCQVTSFLCVRKEAGGAAKHAVVCVGLLHTTNEVATLVSTRDKGAFAYTELRAAHMAFEYAVHSTFDGLMRERRIRRETQWATEVDRITRTLPGSAAAGLLAEMCRFVRERVLQQKMTNVEVQR